MNMITTNDGVQIFYKDWGTGQPIVFSHARTLSVSRAPDGTGGSHILAYPHSSVQQRESPLIGTPDEILAKLQELNIAGVDYVMLNAAGSRANLRRFALEVMPHVPVR